MSGREITVHRVGTPEAPHFTTAAAFRDYLTAVVEGHEPTSDYPEAVLEFPAGWWVTLTTGRDKPAPQPGEPRPVPDFGPGRWA